MCFLSNQIASAVNEGKLVPEEVIFGLLSKRLEEGYYRGETGFILDGIPRTPLQAVSLWLSLYVCVIVVILLSVCCSALFGFFEFDNMLGD